MEQLRLEAFYLGLRTKKGIFLKDFENQYHYDLFTFTPLLHDIRFLPFSAN